MNLKVKDFIDRISEYNTVVIMSGPAVLGVYDGHDKPHTPGYLWSPKYNEYKVNDFNINRKLIELYV